MKNFYGYQVSHWGNIATQSFFQLLNQGPSLKGEFSRAVYNWMNPHTGKNAITKMDAELPYHTWGLWYRDEIGNISTSNAWRDVK